MQHVIAAVFANQANVNQARNDLINSGFSPDDMHLSQNNDLNNDDYNDEHVSKDESITSGIKSFFSNMFGDDNKDDADVYSSAVMNGNFVLTLNLQNEEDVDKATEVIDRSDPIDIDEQTSETYANNNDSKKSIFGDSAVASSKLDQSKNVNKTQLQNDNNETAIPIIKEELKVGKRMVQRGGVRVFQKLVETPVSQNVNLREEHVTIERHPVNQTADIADLNAFKEGTLEFRETAEEAVVEKTAKVVEEVTINKKTTAHDKVISDTLRSTSVEVEEFDDTSDPKDADYRTHFNSNYANAGSYDDYAPSYRYGSTMSNDARYKNAKWDDIESDAKSDWESKNVGSSWEKMKGAVRQGWEKMTS